MRTAASRSRCNILAQELRAAWILGQLAICLGPLGASRGFASARHLSWPLTRHAAGSAALDIPSPGVEANCSDNDKRSWLLAPFVAFGVVQLGARTRDFWRSVCSGDAPVGPGLMRSRHMRTKLVRAWRPHIISPPETVPAQEQKEVTKCVKNVMVTSCLMLGDPDNQSRQRLITSATGPWEAWHSLQNARLRCTEDSAEWSQAQITGSYMVVQEEVWSKLRGTNTLDYSGFELGLTRSSRAWIQRRCNVFARTTWRASSGP